MMNSLLKVVGVFTLALAVACSTAEDPVSVDDTGKEAGEIAVTGITITTTTAKYLTSVSATTGGTITSTKTIKERGVCYATTTKPTIAGSYVVSGSGSGTFESVLTGLQANTKYYVRAYVKYGADKVAYGTQTSFTTLQSYGTMTDADGNEYATVTIGNQVWMAENLRTTSYRDGSAIENVTAGDDWKVLTTGAFCVYNNDEANAETYGLLYNWHAVGSAANIAPAGWHVPTSAEFRTMIDYFGGLNSAGGYMKEVGFDHWSSPNTGATNAAGFNARGNGARMYYALNSVTNAGDVGLKEYSPWWTSTSADTTATFVQCNYADDNAYRGAFLGGIRYNDKRTGYAVRLVKD